MKRIALMGVVAVMVSVLAASGVALAMTINCKANTRCNGTKNSDTMTGSTGSDGMYGRGGNDTMKGRGGEDIMHGDTGADKVIGGPAGDAELWGGGVTQRNDTHPDKSDDTVHGALGNDYILGGFGQGGVDHVFGDGGNDTILADQRGSLGGVQVTKEVVDCGAGDDTVYRDGKDVIANNCEHKKSGP